MGRSGPDGGDSEGGADSLDSGRSNPPGAAGGATGDPRKVEQRAYLYPVHSDGVVCRCAVRWRREALARGLADDPKPAPRP